MDTTESICSRCFLGVEALVAPPCKEKPELLVGVPLGMYHCPDCGTMVIAGTEHPYVCTDCCDTIKKEMAGG